MCRYLLHFPNPAFPNGYLALDHGANITAGSVTEGSVVALNAATGAESGLLAIVLRMT
jgi:hypothetical protein